MVENKYKRWYFSIIENAHNRTLQEEVYYEQHHILPKSLGGSNDKDNLVKLTAKEHFICHLLLTRFTTGEAKSKMSFAVWRLCNGKTMQHKSTNSKTYDTARKVYAETMSKLLAGRIVTEETRRKMTGKRPNFVQVGEQNNAFKGWLVTPWGTFASAKEAKEQCPYAISESAIRSFCNMPHKPIQRVTSNCAALNMKVSETPHQYGFGFKSK